MFSKIKGEITPLSEPQSFEIERIRENILKNPLSPDMNNYIKDLKAFKIKLEPILKEFSSASKKLIAFEHALAYSNEEPGSLESEIINLKKHMFSLNQRLYGNASKKEIDEKDIPSISDRLSVAQKGFSKTYGPTSMHMESLDMAKALFNRIEPELNTFVKISIPAIEDKLVKAGVPIILD